MTAESLAARTGRRRSPPPGSPLRSRRRDRASTARPRGRTGPTAWACAHSQRSRATRRTAKLAGHEERPRRRADPCRPGSSAGTNPRAPPHDRRRHGRRWRSPPLPYELRRAVHHPLPRSPRVVSHSRPIHDSRHETVHALPRQLWLRLETIHDLTYFSPRRAEQSEALGLRGFWMSYFAFRAAPLGPVGPATVTAAFFGFHPSRVRRALPDAWDRTTPARPAARATASTRRSATSPARTTTRARRSTWPGARRRPPTPRSPAGRGQPGPAPAGQPAGRALAGHHRAARAPRRRSQRRPGQPRDPPGRGAPAQGRRGRVRRGRAASRTRVPGRRVGRRPRRDAGARPAGRGRPPHRPRGGRAPGGRGGDRPGVRAALAEPSAWPRAAGSATCWTRSPARSSSPASSPTPTPPAWSGRPSRPPNGIRRPAADRRWDHGRIARADGGAGVPGSGRRARAAPRASPTRPRGRAPRGRAGAGRAGPVRDAALGRGPPPGLRDPAASAEVVVPGPSDRRAPSGPGRPPAGDPRRRARRPGLAPGRDRRRRRLRGRPPASQPDKRDRVGDLQAARPVAQLRGRRPRPRPAGRRPRDAGHVRRADDLGLGGRRAVPAGPRWPSHRRRRRRAVGPGQPPDRQLPDARRLRRPRPPRRPDPVGTGPPPSPWRDEPRRPGWTPPALPRCSPGTASWWTPTRTSSRSPAPCRCPSARLRSLQTAASPSPPDGPQAERLARAGRDGGGESSRGADPGTGAGPGSSGRPGRAPRSRGAVRPAVPLLAADLSRHSPPTTARPGSAG